VKFRVGFGFDVHQLVDGAMLVLGGVNIRSDKGAVGHSDADVLIHAICDALLGAANLRDIGHHFPNTDDKYKGADSKELLSRVVQMLSEAGYQIGNVDATLSLEEPKISPYIEAMQATLAPLLKVEKDDISIKATTNEKLGYVGKRKGLNAYAVALIYK
jgi:2-C-methyl-D-erythritol 2,4-cyclodiphosphate synthase